VFVLAHGIRLHPYLQTIQGVTNNRSGHTRQASSYHGIHWLVGCIPIIDIDIGIDIDIVIVIDIPVRCLLPE